jgi:hypothetical protein
MPSGQAEHLLLQAEDLPYGEARSLMLEEALRLAEAGHETLLAFQIRLDLVSAYTLGGETAKAFAPFSRCLAEYDREPGRYTDYDKYLLLWSFKYMAAALTKFPEVPLARTYAVLDDMERRYRADGHTMHPVYAYRCHVANHVGDTDAVERWLAKWRTAPRGPLSDCRGCDPTGTATVLTWLGRYEEATRVAVPVLGGRFTCADQPQDILTALLTPYLHTGRYAAAAAAHRRAYRLMRGNPHWVEELGIHLEFCARTGNEARGLEIIDHNLGLLDRSPNPRAEMNFAAAAASLLARVRGDLSVRGRPAASLGAEMERRAREIAARFDDRNATTEQTRQVAGRIAAEPFTDRLPLGVEGAGEPEGRGGAEGAGEPEDGG